MILKKTVLEGGGPDDSGAILGMLAIGGMFIFTNFTIVNKNHSARIFNEVIH